MARKSLRHLECAVANTAEVVSDAWTTLILRDAFLGVRRFDDFVSDLGIARNILADRLDRLIEAGVLETRPYQERPLRHDYRLTEKGKDLFDLLMTLWSYGERWNPPALPGRQRAIHVPCGHVVEAVAHCGHCGERLSRREVSVEPGLPVVAARESAGIA
jgi:DNA-binding HxlR family transcriptional regulator